MAAVLAVCCGPYRLLCVGGVPCCGGKHIIIVRVLTIVLLCLIILVLVRRVLVKSRFFSNPAKVAATAATTGKRGPMDQWFLGFPRPHSRGRRMAQRT